MEFFPFTGLPGADVPVATISSMLPTNATTTAFGLLFTTNWGYAMYETRPNGTLWAAPLSLPPLRIGLRSDWISVWGGYYGTVIGLTSDGTLWTLGLDYGQEQHFDLGEKLGRLKYIMAKALGSTPGRGNATFVNWTGYQMQKEPRPLLRLVATNSTPTRPP